MTTWRTRALDYLVQPRLWFEIVMLAVLYIVYSFIRNLVHSDRDEAFVNGRAILDWQDGLHLSLERPLNDLVDAVPAIAAVSAVIYASLHFVVTPAVLGWLFVSHSKNYRFFSTALIITTGLALIGFFLLPTAPPRMLTDEGFVDIMAKTGSWGWWPESGTPASDNISNQFAAMPSLHCAWATFCGIVIVMYTKNHIVRVLGALYPVLTYFVVMGTANHYLLDIVGGLVTLLAGFILTWLLRMAWRAYLARHLDPRIVTQLSEKGAA
jgi:hypothetical protein